MESNPAATLGRLPGRLVLARPAAGGARAAAVVRAAAAAVLAGLAGLGCYNPQVTSGRLHCAAPPGKACPDGFVCAGGFCVHPGTTGGSGGSGGGQDAGPDGNAPDVMEPCLSPRPQCEPQSGMCDPYCQTGCAGCREKCSVNGSGALVCTETVSRPRQVGQTCLLTNAGQPNQGDECAPGLVCIEDCGGGGGGRCYQFCRSDGECPQSTCSRMVPGGGNQRVCEVPFVACNPQDDTGCSDSAQDCYLLSSDPRPGGSGDRTVCDCPMAARAAGQTCSDSRDCIVGLVCPTSGPGGGFCRRVCDPAAANPGCQGTQQCRRYGASWGYCM